MLTTKTLSNNKVAILCDGFVVFVAHDAEEAARIMTHA
jgi:hypothetical protein